MKPLEGARSLVNREGLGELPEGVFRTDATQGRIGRRGVLLPMDPVNDVRRALQDPFVERTGMIRTVEHPADPRLHLLADPVRTDGVRPASGVCPPLGVDDAAVPPARAGA